MSTTRFIISQPLPFRRQVLYGLLLVASGLVALFALLSGLNTNRTVALRVGEVATQDVLSPGAIRYNSTILTTQEQAAKAAAVQPVYAAPDASVARQQVGQLRLALNFINSVRADSFATPEQKLADLAALQDVRLSQADAAALLALSETGWQSVQAEAIVVLEQLMRSTIREDRLEEARRSVPALVSLSLPEDQAALVATLVQAFVSPNSLYSEDLTEARRQEARDAVGSVLRSFAPNETVIRRGQVVTDLHIEALQEMGLASPRTTWQQYVQAISAVLLGTVLVGLFFNQRRDLLESPRELVTMTLLMLTVLLISRFTIPNRTVIPFVFPIASFALVATALFSSQAALVFAIPLSLLAAYGLPNAFELFLYYLLPAMLGVLVLRRAERLGGFLWAGFTISAACMAVVLLFRLGDPNTDLVGLLTLISAGGLNGLLAASIALILQFVIAQLLGVTTILQLLELSRPDHPLLQLILRNAPGTYQHSLQIANLAEQAAELIGADATLVRVGALYHDAGKARQPHYFIENQIPGTHNPHDDLDAYESSHVIIQHVPDGMEMAEKHRLPLRIRDFIAEHHGTLATMYQYSQAVEAAGGDREKVDIEAFRYPGPRPRSRETALVMLADGCEARTRAERPENEEQLRKLVKDVVDRRVAQGQLDDTRLTMQDLATIVDSFTTTLRGVYHPRIKYPDLGDEPALDVSVEEENVMPPEKITPSNP
jgi:hypothetical protein